jgi:hypothetical protein
MKRFHPLKPYKSALKLPLLLLLAGAVFAAVVLGGLYGPGLAAKASAERAYFKPEVAEREASVYFRNCAAAHAAGVYSVRRGQPGYRPDLDRDGDGRACEPYVG